VRILFVNEKCGYFGGVEQNVAVTSQGLRSMGHQCFLAYGFTTEQDFDGYKSLFDDVFRCREICHQDWNCTGQSFEDIVNTVSPDVLYLHKVSTTDFCLSFLTRIRIVKMVHDHDLCCPRRHKYFFHNERICHSKAGWRCYLDLAFLAGSAGPKRTVTYVSIPDKLREMRRNYRLDRLLVGSRFMKDELLQNGFPESKVSIVHPIMLMKPAKISPIPHEPVVLCVAQLIKGKGVDLLLQALKKLTCDFQAIIVGTGNAESYLKNLSRDLGLEERVHFQGWVNNFSISDFYSKARVVAVPSRWPEPFGMIGLEAMRHGRPVVAFDVGGIPDWLEHDVTGLLVPERDVIGLAKALERLLLDLELARRLGEMAILRAHERFSFEDYLKQIEQHLGGHCSASSKGYRSCDF
jgi:glycosyltransferase involved in cell wall biosynthesis